MEPLLHFINEKGTYVAEYIPPNHTVLMNWLRWKLIILRDHFGKDFYYWDIRHLHHHEFRKTADIEFVLHVIKDHDYKPSDPTEKKHFDKAWKLYGTELQYVLEALAKDEGKELEDSKIVRSHHYAHAYKDKWFPKHTEPETKLTYHGVKFYEMANYFEQSIGQETIRLNAYLVDHGLDPKTGKKLNDTKPKTAKQSKRSSDERKK